MYISDKNLAHLREVAPKNDNFMGTYLYTQDQLKFQIIYYLWKGGFGNIDWECSHHTGFSLSVCPAYWEKPETGRQQSEDQWDKTFPLTNERVSWILIEAILFLIVQICSREIIIFGCTLPLTYIGNRITIHVTC